MKNTKNSVKVIAILLVAIMCLSIVSCNIKIPVNSGTGTTSNKEENESGPFASFDDIYTQNAYLGYGIDIINASDINSQDVLMTYPIFDMDKLMDEKLLKIDDHGTSFESIEASSIEEFIENMSHSSSITSGSSVSASGSFSELDIGASVSFSNGLKTSFAKANEHVQSQYFLKIIAESKSYWLMLQTTEQRYKEILSDEFKRDLYDYDGVSPAQLFQKYGTHLLTSVAMGGNVYMYYTMFSYYEETSSTEYAEIASSIKSSVKASYGSFSAGTENNLSFSEAYTYDQKAKEYGISIDQRIYSIGGSFFGIMNEQTLYENYGDWQKSLVDEPVLIGIKDDNSLYPIWKLLDLDVEGAVERQNQLYEYFMAYGKDSYNELASIYELKPIVQPKEIVNICVGDRKDYQRGHEIQIKAGDVINISFDVLPENAIDYTKTFAVDDTSKAVIDKNGKLTVSGNVKNGDLITVTIRAGAISETIWLRVIEDVKEEPEDIVSHISYNLNTLNNTIKGEVSINSDAVAKVIKDKTTTLSTAFPVTYSKYYSFDGWYTSKLLETKLTDKNGKLLTNVTGYTDSNGVWIGEEDVEIYAKWIQNYPEYVYIETPDELQYKLSNNPEEKYKIIKDIDMKHEVWIPIREFSGELDGDGHCIYNFSINQAGQGSANIGFICSLTASGKITNLTIGKEDCHTFANNQYSVSYEIDYDESSKKEESHVYVGAFVGLNRGDIINCQLINTDIFARFDDLNNNDDLYLGLGGLVGFNYGKIEDCDIKESKLYIYSPENGNSGDDQHGYIGGICGWNESGEVRYCFSEKTILNAYIQGNGTKDNKAYVYLRMGGIVGIQQAKGVIHSCDASDYDIENFLIHYTDTSYTDGDFMEGKIVGRNMGGRVT